MGFFKRLLWYILGLSVGMVFLWFIVDKKTNGKGIEYCYLPNCRVLKDLRNAKVLEGTDSVQLRSILLNSKVNFSKSNTRLDPCKSYYLEQGDQSFVVEKCPEGIRRIR